MRLPSTRPRRRQPRPTVSALRTWCARTNSTSSRQLRRRRTVCRAHTTCLPTQWETVRPTTTSDRVCKAHTICSSSQWETKQASVHHDRECRFHTTCLPGLQYESRGAGKHQDRECSLISTCPAGQQELEPPTTTSDRRCSDCTAGKYKASAGNSERCRNCYAGQFQNRNGANTCKNCPWGTFQGSWPPCVTTARGATRTARCSVVQVVSRGPLHGWCARVPCHACDYTCPAGQYHSGCGLKNPGGCNRCAAGYHKSAAGPEGCSPCAKGTFAAAEETHDCASVPAASTRTWRGRMRARRAIMIARRARSTHSAPVRTQATHQVRSGHLQACRWWPWLPRLRGGPVHEQGSICDMQGLPGRQIPRGQGAVVVQRLQLLVRRGPDPCWCVRCLRDWLCSTVPGRRARRMRQLPQGPVQGFRWQRAELCGCALQGSLPPTTVPTAATIVLRTSSKIAKVHTAARRATTGASQASITRHVERPRMAAVKSARLASTTTLLGASATSICRARPV